MSEKKLEVWEMWYPKGGAAGMSFARSRIDPAEVVLVHAAPQVLTVTVRGEDGTVRAEGEDLEVQSDTPMARLRCSGKRIEREDIWPGTDDIGRVVIMPGGEAGVLTSWWHAEDRSEWRWTLELYNRKAE